MLGHRRGFIAGAAGGAALAVLVVVPVTLLNGSINAAQQAQPEATATRYQSPLPQEPTAAELPTPTPADSPSESPAEVETSEPEPTPETTQAPAPPVSGPALDPTPSEEPSPTEPTRTRPPTSEQGPGGSEQPADPTPSRRTKESVAYPTRTVPPQVVPGKFTVRVIGDCEQGETVRVEWTTSSDAVEYVVTVAGPMSGGGRTTAQSMDLECPTQTGTVSIRIDALPASGTPVTSSSTSFYVQPPLDEQTTTAKPHTNAQSGTASPEESPARTDRTPTDLSRATATPMSSPTP